MHPIQGSNECLIAQTPAGCDLLEGIFQDILSFLEGFDYDSLKGDLLEEETE